jgi:8-oxo-dGTP pyrophosphatase MutT (NUDIX family)
MSSPPPVVASDSVFDQTVGWANILAAVLGLLALVVALGIGTTTLQVYVLRRMRWKKVGRRVRSATRTHSGTRQPSRRSFGRITSRLLRSRAERGGARVLDELNWLSELFAARQPERFPPMDPPAAEGSATEDVPMPFSFAEPVTASYQEVMRDLALGYAEYAAALRKRWLLRSAAGPMLKDEYDCAVATSELIERHGRYRLLSPEAGAPGSGDEAAGLRERWVALRPHSEESDDGPRTSERRVRLVTWPDMALQRASVTFPSVAVSYQPYRVAEVGKPGADNLPEGLEVRQLVRQSTIAHRTGASYDGIMTRLHGADGFRLELDPHSGRQRLHLCLSETSYWAFQLSQWEKTRDQRRAQDAGVSRLLSVNLLLIDDADHVLLVRRNAAVVHGGGIAGAVSGASEVVAREGIEADIDDVGVPDPLRTFVREGREELGIDLRDPAWKLGVLGLIQVVAPHDLGTYVLTGLARLPSPAAQFRLRPGDTDDVEGTWELGSDAMVVDLRAVLSSDPTLTEFVTWIRSDPEILPHAAGALLLLLVTRLHIRRAQGRTDGASMSSLVELIQRDAPVAVGPRPDSVQFQPLWADEH